MDNTGKRDMSNTQRSRHIERHQLSRHVCRTSPDGNRINCPIDMDA